MPEPKFLTDNIPHEYILLPNVKHAFDPEGVGLNWSLEECEFKKGSNQYISICYYVKDTNYAVVDIDTDDYSLDQLFEDTEIDSMWVKGNTTGFHVWVEFPNGKPDAYRRTEQNCSNLCKMDFLGEKVWERLDKAWTGEFPCHIHAEQFEKCFDMQKFAPKKKTEKKTHESTGDKELLTKMVDLIHMKYCYEMGHWLKIFLAMKKCGFTEEFAMTWSAKAVDYAEENGLKMNCIESENSTTWNQYIIEEITATEGTIRYYAKLSNPTEYTKLTANQFPTDTMDIQKLIKLKSDIVIHQATDEEIEAVEKLNAKEKKKAERQLKMTTEEQLWKRFKNYTTTFVFTVKQQESTSYDTERSDYTIRKCFCD